MDPPAPAPHPPPKPCRLLHARVRVQTPTPERPVTWPAQTLESTARLLQAHQAVECEPPASMWSQPELPVQGVQGAPAPTAARSTAAPPSREQRLAPRRDVLDRQLLAEITAAEHAMRRTLVDDRRARAASVQLLERRGGRRWHAGSGAGARWPRRPRAGRDRLAGPWHQGTDRRHARRFQLETIKVVEYDRGETRVQQTSEPRDDVAALVVTPPRGRSPLNYARLMGKGCLQRHFSR